MSISTSAIYSWTKAYSEVKIDNDTILTAKQIKELQKRNALLEEENIILKKAHNFCFAKTLPPVVPVSSGI
jgi:transposase